jgi:preprotein translocase subunit YajC
MYTNFAVATAAGGGLSSTLIMVVIMVAIFYFMLIRPENKRKKEAENMRNSLKKGDWITTIGGVYGRVVAITDRTVVIETSEDRVRVEFLKSAIGNVGTLDDQAAAAQRPGRKAAREEPSADDLPESGENMVEE